MILKSITDVNQERIIDFTCGINQLDYFLKKHAFRNDQNGYGKTFILENDDAVIGFFTLCSAQIKFETYPNVSKEALPKYPIPCVKIARLAVSKDYQNKGYGRELLKRAFLKIASVSNSVGIKLILVDAKESSKPFYEKYGFKPLVDGTLTYYLPLETIIEAMKSR